MTVSIYFRAKNDSGSAALYLGVTSLDILPALGAKIECAPDGLLQIGILEDIIWNLADDDDEPYVSLYIRETDY